MAADWWLAIKFEAALDAAENVLVDGFGGGFVAAEVLGQGRSAYNTLSSHLSTLAADKYKFF